jgi:hypothetical protein
MERLLEIGIVSLRPIPGQGKEVDLVDPNLWPVLNCDTDRWLKRGMNGIGLLKYSNEVFTEIYPLKQSARFILSVIT